MMSVLLQGLFGVASSAVEGFVETKKAKARQKLVKIEAETSLMEKKISGEIDWDKAAIDGARIVGRMSILQFCSVYHCCYVSYPLPWST